MHKPMLFLAISLSLAASPAAADDRPAAPAAPATEDRQVSGQGTAAATIVLDVEVDPLAYALGGYSVHAGLARGRLRLDLGAFALDMPEFAHGNDGLSAAFHGVGIKLDVFARTDQSGPFIGVEASWARSTVEHDASGAIAVDSDLRLGVRGGYRFMLSQRWYAVPWIGVSRAQDAGDIAVGDTMFHSPRWFVFPALHVGYRAD